MKIADMTLGAAVGMIAGLSVGMVVASDKKKKNKIMRAAKKTVDAVEDTVKSAVDFID